MQSSSKFLLCSSNSNPLFGSPSAVTATLLPSCLRFPPLSLTIIANSSSIRFKPLRSTASSSDSPQFTEMASKDSKDQDPRIARISSAIRIIPDFPKPGIMFQDITTLLLDTKAFKDTIDLFVERYRDQNISVVAGVEARGFIFGPPIALAIGAKFVPMRKPKKLPDDYGLRSLNLRASYGILIPREVISEEYSLEYGTDKIEMHVGAVQPGERALVIDDLIATGGTLCAAIKLLERVGVNVVECACVIELPELKGREKLGGKSLFILVEGEGA
ncbi:adenine phosphoribosyltransferase chloroplastic-like [Trifolium pratense]|uniref:adenine phosphoribosyltransferase n=2 Tax=Trifolium TaxID=3898 RepID=A0A2K3P723_TRIPR|nr:adenine phosphoribosyltransferase chloroplastic-like [Trifolium pratense]